jgi:hypothetical protein
MFYNEFHWEKVVLYTFDGKDSCIILADSLIGEYSLPFDSIPVPEGYYFFKGATDTSFFYHPPNQAPKLTK